MITPARPLTPTQAQTITDAIIAVYDGAYAVVDARAHLDLADAQGTEAYLAVQAQADEAYEAALALVAHLTDHTAEATR